MFSFRSRIKSDLLNTFCEDSIGTDPLPAGQVWAISPGGQDEAAGLFRIDATEGPGGGVRILNQSPPAPTLSSDHKLGQTSLGSALLVAGLGGLQPGSAT